MLFTHLDDFDKFASCVCPATQMHNIRLLIQMIITGKVITLDVAVVIIQKIQGHFTAAGGMILIQQHRMIRLTAAIDPHVRLAGIGPPRFV